MKRQIQFCGKTFYDGKWVYGFYYGDSPLRDISIIGVTPDITYHVIPDTVSEFTGKKLCKGNKVFEGTIAFYEDETEDGDVRTYLVCVWIDEWSMFAWLTTGEYIKYQDMGAKALDEASFWTYTLEGSEKYHYAGNIFDHSHLLNR